MSILGLGTDIISIDRITSSIERRGDTFKTKIFTAAEIKACDARGNGANAAYARRWAAKEACVKALGSGIAEGVAWTDMNITNDDLGAPSITLTGGALAVLNKMLPFGAKADIKLSMSDDKPWATAVVIISAESAES